MNATSASAQDSNSLPPPRQLTICVVADAGIQNDHPQSGLVLDSKKQLFEPTRDKYVFGVIDRHTGEFVDQGATQNATDVPKNIAHHDGNPDFILTLFSGPTCDVHFFPQGDLYKFILANGGGSEAFLDVEQVIGQFPCATFNRIFYVLISIMGGNNGCEYASVNRDGFVVAALLQNLGGFWTPDCVKSV